MENAATMKDAPPPIGSVWNAYHSQGEDVVLVTGEPNFDGRRVYVPIFVMTSGQETETWLANFQTWVRVL